MQGVDCVRGVDESAAWAHWRKAIHCRAWGAGRNLKARPSTMILRYIHPHNRPVMARNRAPAKMTCGCREERPGQTSKGRALCCAAWSCHEQRAPEVAVLFVQQIAPHDGVVPVRRLRRVQAAWCFRRGQLPLPAFFLAILARWLARRGRQEGAGRPGGGEGRRGRHLTARTEQARRRGPEKQRPPPSEQVCPAPSMSFRDSGLRAAGGIAKKVRQGAKGAAAGGGGDRKGQHSIEFHKSKGQHILKNPLVRTRLLCGSCRTSARRGGEAWVPVAAAHAAALRCASLAVAE